VAAFIVRPELRQFSYGYIAQPTLSVCDPPQNPSQTALSKLIPPGSGGIGVTKSRAERAAYVGLRLPKPLIRRRNLVLYACSRGFLAA